jgi:hypothetical protein
MYAPPERRAHQLSVHLFAMGNALNLRLSSASRLQLSKTWMNSYPNWGASGIANISYAVQYGFF